MILVMFGVLIPVGTTVYCMGFCCARVLVERCHCCCVLCKQPNCGSPKPTEDYKTPEKVCVSACLILLVLIFITISILGFLATMQMATDFQEVLNSMDSAVAFPDEWSKTVNTSFEAIDKDHEDFADRINVFTTQGGSLKASAVALNNSVKVLITKWQSIGNLVEGTQNSGSAANPCAFYYNSSLAVKYDGEIGMWTYNYTSPLGAVPIPGVLCCEAVNHTNCIRGYHPAGRGTTLASNKVSPTCSTFRRDGLPHNGTVVETKTTCPCCCTCQVLHNGNICARFAMTLSVCF